VASKEAAPDPSLGIAVTPVHVGGESFLERLAPHIKKIAVALIALILVLTAVFSFRWYRHGQEEKSTSRLVKAIELGERQVLPPEIDLSAIPGQRDTKTWKSYDERAQATLDALAKVGSARGAASLYEAGLLITAGKPDQAIAIYRRVGTGTSDDAVLAREGLGIVLENQAVAATDAAAKAKLYGEALAAFRAEQPDDKGLRRDYALYHEARVLEATGKTGEAVAQLKLALELMPDSALKPQIENRLAVLGASAPK